MTESIPNPVPTTDNPDAWRKFIDNELPLIETTADERELRRARKVLLTEAMHGDTELLQNHCTLGTESLQHALLDDSAVVVMCERRNPIPLPHSLPVNPEEYEGRLSGVSEFVYEHFADRTQQLVARMPVRTAILH